MPIVKKRKRNFLTVENELYEVEVKINLNKEDLFEFDLPPHYIELFKEMEVTEIRSRRIRFGKVNFESMVEFEGMFEAVNAIFKTKLIERTQEKVLIIYLEAKTKFNGHSEDTVFRVNWGGVHDLNTFINFDFERALKVGNVIYKVGSSGLRDDECDGWSRYQNTITTRGLARDSKETLIMIPYTKEREVFLKNFRSELQNFIRRIDKFADLFNTPQMLALMDNPTGLSLLSAPDEKLDFIEAEEVKDEQR